MDIKRVLENPYWNIMTREEKKKALLLEKLGDLPTTPENIAVLREIVKSYDTIEESFPLVDEFIREHGIIGEALGILR
ncbi:MAG: hypothetical protein J1F39_02010 [Clostridiales bacterium]|nr:hypothetical protein [Clostridiales bacterium]